jgi:hypothetical protein
VSGTADGAAGGTGTAAATGAATAESVGGGRHNFETAGINTVSSFGPEQFCQSFTASGLLRKVGIILSKFGSPDPTGNVVAKIYAADGSHKPTGPQIGVTSNSFNVSVLTTTGIVVELVFPTGINLAPATEYCVVISRDTSVGEVDITFNNSGTYSGGQLSWFTSGSWNSFATADVVGYLEFYIGAGTATAVGASASILSGAGSASGIGAATGVSPALALLRTVVSWVELSGTAIVAGTAIGSAAGTGQASAAGAATAAGAGSSTGAGAAIGVAPSVEPPVFAGGGYWQWPQPRFVAFEGIGYGILPHLEGEAFGLVGAVGDGVAAIPSLAGAAAGMVGLVGRSAGRLAIKAMAVGDHGQVGAATAVLRAATASGSGVAGARGSGSGCVVGLAGRATGRHDDDEAAIVALLLAA